MKHDDHQPELKTQGWGHCQHCRYFGQEGAKERTANMEERHCGQPELEEFELVVTGSSGCNHFEKAAGVSTSIEEPVTAPTFH